MDGIPRSAAPPPITTQALAEWFAAALPDEWCTTAPEVLFDDDEIVVTINLAANDTDDEADPEARIIAHREATRDRRMEIAERAQAHFCRTVSWGARAGDLRARFTHLSAPAMTRLRIEERQVLDTLIEGGVARSRSEALAWCVRLVAEHEADWIAELRDAAESIRTVRDRGPDRA